jgi:hypothetical protein
MITLNKELLSKFLEEIIGFKSHHTLKNPELASIIQLVDPDSAKWHINDSRVVWRLAEWRTEYARLEQIKKDSALYNSTLDARKLVVEQLSEGIRNFLGVESTLALTLALDMIHKDNVAGAMVFGVDISNIPELPKRHIVIEEGRSYEL